MAEIADAPQRFSREAFLTEQRPFNRRWLCDLVKRRPNDQRLLSGVSKLLWPERVALDDQ